MEMSRIQDHFKSSGQLIRFITVADKFISSGALLAYLALSLTVSRNLSDDLSAIMVATIFGYFLTLGQDWQILAFNVAPNYYRWSGVVVLLGGVIWGAMGHSTTSILLFLMTAAGRFEVLRYNGKQTINKIQAALTLLCSGCMTLVLYIPLDNGAKEIFYVVYPIVRYTFLEFTFYAYIKNCEDGKFFDSFRPALAISAGISTFISFGMPFMASHLVADQGRFLTAYIWTQRALSVPQQVGVFTARMYVDLRQAVRGHSKEIIAGVLGGTIVAAWGSWIGAVNIYLILYVIALSASAVLYGSWSLSSTKKGLTRYQLYQHVVATIAAVSYLLMDLMNLLHLSLLILAFLYQGIISLAPCYFSWSKSEPWTKI